MFPCCKLMSKQPVLILSQTSLCFWQHQFCSCLYVCFHFRLVEWPPPCLTLGLYVVTVLLFWDWCWYDSHPGLGSQQWMQPRGIRTHISRPRRRGGEGGEWAGGVWTLCNPLIATFMMIHFYARKDLYFLFVCIFRAWFSGLLDPVACFD